MNERREVPPGAMETGPDAGGGPGGPEDAADVPTDVSEPPGGTQDSGAGDLGDLPG